MCRTLPSIATKQHLRLFGAPSSTGYYRKWVVTSSGKALTGFPKCHQLRHISGGIRMLKSAVKAIVLMGGSLVLTACQANRVKELEAENAELTSQVSALQARVEEAQSAAEDVKAKAEEVASASEDLQSQTGRLDSENWRDVVPDLTSASDDVDTAQTALASSTSDLDAALDQ